MHQRLTSHHALRRFSLFFGAALLGIALSVSSASPADDDKDKPKDNPVPARVAEVKKHLGTEFEELDKLYKHLHVHPELSLHEEKTAARMAQELKNLGFEVTEKVGGHGVVGVLKNGKGPTVLVRTDMDALPVTEMTGLPYKSTVKVRDKNDNEVGVMHACGHDMHMTCWVGTARVLVAMTKRWQGTLVFIAQPAEEIGQGAKAMMKDGLLEKFPRPDYALALHCDHSQPYGSIAYTDGMALANVDAVDILVKGKGGHGSAPHTTVDPIVLSARLILDLQTLVSRETNPTDPAVVTVGSIHGGTKHNIIPNEVKMQITVRTTKDSVRKNILDGIGRIARAAAEGAKAPEPEVTVNPEEFTPALVNEPRLTEKTVTLFKEVLGADKVLERPLVMGGEDFGRYGRDGKVPIFLYFLGTVPPEKVEAAKHDSAKSLPSLHSDLFYPTPEPSIKTGVLTMSMAVLNLVGK
jgi:amidohydrolase